MATAVDAAKEFVEGPCVPEAVQKLLEGYPLAKLCEALGNAQQANREVLLVALEKLAGFEEIWPPFIASPTGAAFLRQGAACGDARLTRLASGMLERLASTEAGVAVLASAGLFQELEVLLLDEEVGTAEAAARSIARAAAWQAGRDAAVGSGGLVQRLQERLQGLGETQQIRVLHLFVELGRASESDVFPALVACGALKSVLAAFITQDILLKLVAVEVMDALGSYQAGQEFLAQHGVPEQLAADLADPCCDESVRLCVTGLLSAVLLRDPSLMGSLLPHQQAPLAQTISAFLESRDVAQRLCGVKAFGNVSAHQAGLEFFLQWPDVTKVVVSMATSSQNEVCKAGLAAWADVLGPRPPKDATQGPDAEVWKLAEQQILPAVLTGLGQKPFPDVRPYTWRLLAIFARSQDAARKMLVSDEMREKLLDFSSETASDAKYAKHEFVRSLVQHQGSWLAAFLDENIEQLLSEFSKQGPFWMPQVSAVSVANQGAA